MFLSISRSSQFEELKNGKKFTSICVNLFAASHSLTVTRKILCFYFSSVCNLFESVHQEYGMYVLHNTKSFEDCLLLIASQFRHSDCTLRGEITYLRICGTNKILKMRGYFAFQRRLTFFCSLSIMHSTIGTQTSCLQSPFNFILPSSGFHYVLKMITEDNS